MILHSLLLCSFSLFLGYLGFFTNTETSLKKLTEEQAALKRESRKEE